VAGQALLGLSVSHRRVGPGPRRGIFVLAARDGGWAAGLGCATLALLLSVTWLMPWYTAWLLPFAAVGESRRLRDAALLLTVLLIVIRMPYGVSG
jgi:hypothetical protein